MIAPVTFERLVVVIAGREVVVWLPVRVVM